MKARVERHAEVVSGNTMGGIPADFHTGRGLAASTTGDHRMVGFIECDGLSICTSGPGTRERKGRNVR